jgi:high affinity sulfate transporter 1
VTTNAPPATRSTAGIVQFVPGWQLARSYQRRWLSKDIVAGLVLSALLIPQGMAYAELAGLPAITGLYTSIMCLLGYAVFGPSRVLVLGPDSALGPMIAATIAPLVLADGDPDRAIALASLLAVIVGVIMTVAGFAKFGFVADLLSKPTQIGYMNGLAITIFVSQLPKLFGFSVDGDGLIAELSAFVRHFGDEVNWTAAAVGIASLVGILLAQAFVPKLPAVLIVVVLASVAVGVFDLTSHGVSTIGVLSRGFPPFKIPTAPWSDVPPLVIGALGIAVVALADTMSTASAFAARRGDRVRGNQEMIGIGAANIAAGLFNGFPVSTSGSRSAVADQAGSRSQVTGVVGAVTIAAVLMLVPSVMKYVPQPTLAAIVIAAAISLVDIKGSRRLWQQRRTEFCLSVAALLGVALLGVLPGILIAIGLSILNVFRRIWWPHEVELGRVAGIDGLHDVEQYPQAARLPGFVVYRFDAPLVFANSRMFSDEIRAIANHEASINWIVIAAEPITDVDTTAADMLEDLDGWLNERGISLVFAEMKNPVRQKIERYELTRSIDPAHFFATVDDAIEQYVSESGASWTAPEADLVGRPAQQSSHE